LPQEGSHDADRTGTNHCYTFKLGPDNGAENSTTNKAARGDQRKKLPAAGLVISDQLTRGGKGPNDKSQK
jgi:hypothetical protein